MAEHDPAGAAKEAAAVKAVELLAACGMILVAVGLQVAQREASDPDFTATLGARLGRWHTRWVAACERGWAGLAGVCWRRAERFRREREGVHGAD